jgi:hypothetical protein
MHGLKVIEHLTSFYLNQHGLVFAINFFSSVNYSHHVSDVVFILANVSWYFLYIKQRNERGYC